MRSKHDGIQFKGSFIVILETGDDESMVEAASFSIQREVQLRFLSPTDIPEVKKLCAEWFPIEYPDVWYQEIASNPKFYSLAATYHSRIIGLIVCEIKQKMMLNKEDSDILAPGFPSTVQVAYILSLGVVVDFRKHGIGSLLLDSLLSNITTKEYNNCKAAYLHVLSTNHNAIRFYERRNFRAHSYLPYYYSIQGKPRDGYSYVLYINGGQPPWSILLYESLWINAHKVTAVCPAQADHEDGAKMFLSYPQFRSSRVKLKLYIINHRINPPITPM